jgi:amino acid permease
MFNSYSPMQDRLLDRQLAFLSQSGESKRNRRRRHRRRQSRSAGADSAAAAGTAAGPGHVTPEYGATDWSQTLSDHDAFDSNDEYGDMPSPGGESELRAPSGAPNKTPPQNKLSPSSESAAAALLLPDFQTLEFRANCAKTPLAAQTKHTHGLLASTLNLANDVVSPSIVAFPFFFSTSPMLVLAAFVVYSILNSRTLIMLHQLSLHTEVYSLAELSFLAQGRTFFGFTLLCMFLFNWGSGVASALVFADVMMSLLHEWVSRTVIMCICFGVVAPLAYFKSIGRFAVLSSISQMSQLAAISLLLVVCVFHAHTNGWHMVEASRDGIWDVHLSTLGAIGGISFMFTCHDMSCHVMTGLKNSTAPRWRVVAIAVPAMLTLYCVIIGLLGFLYIGNTSDLLVAKPLGNGIYMKITRALMAFACLFNIPYNVYMPRVAIMSLMQVIAPRWSIKDRSKGNRSRRNTVHIIMTTLILASELAVVVSVTDLGTFVALVGVSGICVGLIIPATCFLLLRPVTGQYYVDTVLPYAIVAAGIVSAVAVPTGIVVGSK